MSRPTFAVCRLHGVGLVTQFPEGCPLGDDDRGAAKLTEIRGRMHWDGKSDPRESEVMGEVFSVCMPCVDRLAPNAHVKFLREKLKGA